MTNIIKFRPHHFLCTIAYQGMGYSKSFIANYDLLVKEIKNNKNLKIQVTTSLDKICSKCPHQIIKSKTCSQEEKIIKLDEAHAKILGLQNGEIISFEDAKQRIKERMSLSLFYEACKPCEWQSLGVCEAALKKLLT